MGILVFPLKDANIHQHAFLPIVDELWETETHFDMKVISRVWQTDGRAKFPRTVGGHIAYQNLYRSLHDY